MTRDHTKKDRFSRPGRFGRLLKGYLVMVGVATHLAGIGAVVYAMKQFELTPRQFAMKLVEKAGIRTPVVEYLISAPVRYADHVLDGEIRRTRPRILMPELAEWDGRGIAPVMRARTTKYEELGIRPMDPCGGGGMLGNVACWLATGSDEAARKALSGLGHFKASTPTAEGKYSNGWELAWAYDLMDRHPRLTPDLRVSVEKELVRVLIDTLALLDEDSVSLWHGRATLASHAWLMAVALTPSAENGALIRRAQGHFLDLMRALRFTEAWPGGYNYWINNRALALALAGAAYVNGLQNAQYGATVRALMERVGLWAVYGARPDKRIVPLGDEGPRVDFKDETRRVIDVLAQVTRSPVLAGFSRYTARLYGRESYYRAYRWSFQLLNDPTVPAAPGVKPGQLEGLGDLLPNATVFGRRGLNLAFIRGGWGEGDTLISFRAGHSFTHHGHYDAGHFTLFKGAPLAIKSGTYGGFFSPHRLNYAIRSVAHNTLLILRPNERVKPNRFFEQNVADGGQRIVMPTGSAIPSVEYWLDNLGQGDHYEGGELRAFSNVEGLYAYLGADLTGAYNSVRYDDTGHDGKVSSVYRELLYLYDEDRLFVHDDVSATDASYTKKWLLHTKARPDVDGATVLVGEEHNGILESSAASALVHVGRSVLRVDRIHPADARLRLVGGPGFRFYVETDGDDTDLDGRNQEEGANLQPWFDTGMWRMEIQPGSARRRDRFLVALSPSLEGTPTPATVLPIQGDSARALFTDRSVVVFVDRFGQRELRFEVPPGPQRLFVTALPPHAEALVRLDGGSERVRADSEGLLYYPLPADSAAELYISW